MASPPPLTKPISDLPLHFALILFPNFQALDVFGPLDALNTIKRLYPSLPLRLSILSSTLSPISTLPSPKDPISLHLGPPPFEQTIVPTHTFSAPPTQPIHILFIPGGFGARLHAKGDWQPVVDYLDCFFAGGGGVGDLRGIFTVCTGSVVLARSRIWDIDAASIPVREREGGGYKKILDGVHATTNKRALQSAKEEHPNVLWESQARWVSTTLALPLTTITKNTATHTTKTVKLWTTSGVSAGIDGIFALISDEYGADIAEYIAQVLEYTRTTDPKDDPFAPKSS